MSLIERTNVTLPREVVEEVREALELIEGATTGVYIRPDDVITGIKREARTALAKLKDALDAERKGSK